MFQDIDTSDIDYLWAEALERLEKEIPESRFRSLFSRMLPLGLSPDGIYSLGVPNKFNQRLVEKTCLGLITSTLREVSGRDDLEAIVLIDESLMSDQVQTHTHALPVDDDPVALSFSYAPLPDDPEETLTAASTTYAPTAPASSAPAPAAHAAHTTPRDNPFNDGEFDTKYTFASFVVGESNNLAYSTALAVAEAPGLKYNPLFIWGSSGVGKTHLLQAIGTHVKGLFPEKTVTYTTAENYMNQYIARVTSKASGSGMESLRKHYRGTDLLLMDDIQFLEKGVESLTHFYHTFNSLHAAHKQIVIAADRPPLELNMDERFTSRFRSGLMVDIQPPVYETRYAILKNYTDGMEIPFTEEALDHIAKKSSDNIREMEGAVNRVAAWAGLSKQPVVTLDIATVATRGYFPERTVRPISIPSVQKEVCRYYNITHADLIGNKRKQDIVFPRHMAMYLCQELTESTLPQIGKAFGGKDHTTVMHAVAKIKKQMSVQPETYDHVQHLTNALRNKAI